MKKSTAAVLMGRFAQPTLYVQRIQNNETTSGTTQSVTFNSNPKSGNLLILIVSAGFTLALPTSTGGTWTKDVTTVANQETSIFSKISNGTETTISIQASGGSSLFSCAMIAYEFAGYTTLDKSAVVNAGGNINTASVGPTATTTASNEIVIGVCEFGYTNTDTIPGSSTFTAGVTFDCYNHSTNTGATSMDDLITGLLKTSSTGAYSCTASWANLLPVLANTNMLIATYK